MTIHVALTHETRYQYDRPVQLGPQTIRLRPAAHSRTNILSYSLSVEPRGHFLNWQQDPYGNFLARVVFPEPVESFEVKVDLVADMAVYNPFDFFLEPDAEKYPFEYEPQLQRELEPFLDAAPVEPALARMAGRVPAAEGAGRPPIFSSISTSGSRGEIEYVVRMEPGIQTPQETLTLKRGSCRDSSWLLVQILRHLGLAARFVSGYLIQLTADVKSLDGPSGTSARLHRSARLGRGLSAGRRVGRSRSDVGSADRRGSHSARVRPTSAVSGADLRLARTVRDRVRLRDVGRPNRRDRRASRSRTPTEQWQRIDALGHRLDAELKAADVRLTIGGEPTFVSIDHPDGEEWNTTATGPTKRVLAAQLIERLRERFAPEGLLHFGQGKWYPGEQLPRWAFALYWRGDGKPLWRDQAYVADEAVDYAPTTAQARAFIEGVARRLDLPVQAPVAAYEDPWYFASQERRLPENLDPLDNKLDDPMARERLARVFERGLGTPVGFVLPVQRWQAAHDRRRWLTESWSTRVEAAVRCCRESRRWVIGCRCRRCRIVAPTRYPRIIPPDPFEPREELAEPDPHRQPFLARRLDARTRSRTRPYDRKPTRPRRGGAGAYCARRRTARRSVERIHAAGRNRRGLSRPASRRWKTPPPS